MIREPCQPYHAGNDDLQNIFRIPNCDDPVFRAWCEACNIRPGELIGEHDLRMQDLQELMNDPTYDPECDGNDDYLTRGL